MYRIVDSKAWTDPKIRKLSIEGKAAFPYLICNSHSHLSGIYILPKVLACYEIGVSDRVYDRVLKEMEDASFAYFDIETDVIFVRNMFKYQGRGKMNEMAAANQLKNLHNSFLIKVFLSIYPSVKKYVSNTLLDTLSNRDIPKEQEQDQEQEQNITPLPPAGDSKAKKQKPKNIEPPIWLPQKSWDELLQHRREIKAPMSPLAQTKAINELERLKNDGNDPVHVIDQSISQGWKGLFPLKAMNGGFRAQPESSGNKAFDATMRNATNWLKKKEAEKDDIE